tara:strand:- start:3179 stop:3397 length:219 start_codon:yes stop_codon:yes gene_type:complete
MIAGESPASKMQMLVAVPRPTMRGVFAVAMISVAMVPVDMVFNHMSTRCRYLMLMLNAYHHAGNNQRQPKKD